MPRKLPPVVSQRNAMRAPAVWIFTSFHQFSLFQRVNQPAGGALRLSHTLTQLGLAEAILLQ